MKNIHILAVSGSLRAASLHKKLVRNLQAFAPDGVTISIFDLNGIPMYNTDLEVDGYPAAVVTWREAIAASDGIIFASPEYNGGMTGAMKNAIDWASREGLLSGRPVTGISGSPGALGGTKGHEDVRRTATHLGMHLLSRPVLSIPSLHTKLETDTLTDERTVEFIEKWLVTFRDWIVRLGN